MRGHKNDDTYRVFLFDRYGRVLTFFDNLSQACQATGLTRANFHAAFSQGPNRPYKGFIWRKEGQPFELPYWVHRQRLAEPFYPYGK